MQKIQWIEEEFKGVEFGDKRLNTRLKVLGSCLYSSPRSKITRACQNWASAKGAYRFFDNKKVTSDIMFSAHQQQTFVRIEKQLKKGDVLLVPQDTTYFNYTHFPTIKGLSKMSGVAGDIYGCLMHSSIAMTEDELPLGIIDQKIFTRKSIDSYQESNHKLRPIDKKESYRWIEQLETLISLKDEYDVVSICDREADIFEYMQTANDFEVSFIIRSRYPRGLFEQGKMGDGHIERLKPAGKIQIEVESNGKKRVATLKVYFDKVTLSKPTRRKEAVSIDLEPQEVTVIYVKEVNAPNKEERIDWTLITNREVLNFESAKRIIGFYKARWNIECWHKTIKSGFSVEDCRLNHYEKLKSYLCLTSILAWKIYFLVKIKRTNPSLECECVFNTEEWKALYLKINKSLNFPKSPPTINVAITWLAQLGGFMNRKGDGEPGMTSLWRGIHRLRDVIEDYKIITQTYG